MATTAVADVKDVTIYSPGVFNKDNKIEQKTAEINGLTAEDAQQRLASLKKGDIYTYRHLVLLIKKANDKKFRLSDVTKINKILSAVENVADQFSPDSADILFNLFQLQPIDLLALLKTFPNFVKKLSKDKLFDYALLSLDLATYILSNSELSKILDQNPYARYQIYQKFSDSLFIADKVLRFNFDIKKIYEHGNSNPNIRKLPDNWQQVDQLYSELNEIKLARRTLDEQLQYALKCRESSRNLQVLQKKNSSKDQNSQIAKEIKAQQDELEHFRNKLGLVDISVRAIDQKIKAVQSLIAQNSQQYDQTLVQLQKISKSVELDKRALDIFLCKQSNPLERAQSYKNMKDLLKSDRYRTLVDEIHIEAMFALVKTPEDFRDLVQWLTLNRNTRQFLINIFKNASGSQKIVSVLNIEPEQLADFAEQPVDNEPQVEDIENYKIAEQALYNIKNFGYMGTKNINKNILVFEETTKGYQLFSQHPDLTEALFKVHPVHFANILNNYYQQNHDIKISRIFTFLNKNRNWLTFAHLAELDKIFGNPEVKNPANRKEWLKYLKDKKDREGKTALIKLREGIDQVISDEDKTAKIKLATLLKHDDIRGLIHLTRERKKSAQRIGRTVTNYPQHWLESSDFNINVSKVIALDPKLRANIQSNVLSNSDNLYLRVVNVVWDQIKKSSGWTENSKVESFIKTIKKLNLNLNNIVETKNTLKNWLKNQGIEEDKLDKAVEYLCDYVASHDKLLKAAKKYFVPKTGLFSNFKKQQVEQVEQQLCKVFKRLPDPDDNDSAPASINRVINSQPDETVVKQGSPGSDETPPQQNGKVIVDTSLSSIDSSSLNLIKLIKIAQDPNQVSELEGNAEKINSLLNKGITSTNFENFSKTILTIFDYKSSLPDDKYLSVEPVVSYLLYTDKLPTTEQQLYQQKLAGLTSLTDILAVLKDQRITTAEIKKYNDYFSAIDFTYSPEVYDAEFKIAPLLAQENLAYLILRQNFANEVSQDPAVSVNRKGLYQTYSKAISSIFTKLTEQEVKDSAWLLIYLVQDEVSLSLVDTIYKNFFKDGQLIASEEYKQALADNQVVMTALISKTIAWEHESTKAFFTAFIEKLVEQKNYDAVNNIILLNNSAVNEFIREKCVGLSDLTIGLLNAANVTVEVIKELKDLLPATLILPQNRVNLSEKAVITIFLSESTVNIFQQYPDLVIKLLSIASENVQARALLANLFNPGKGLVWAKEKLSQSELNKLLALKSAESNFEKLIFQHARFVSLLDKTNYSDAQCAAILSNVQDFIADGKIDEKIVSALRTYIASHWLGDQFASQVANVARLFGNTVLREVLLRGLLLPDHIVKLCGSEANCLTVFFAERNNSELIRVNFVSVIKKLSFDKNEVALALIKLEPTEIAQLDLTLEQLQALLNHNNSTITQWVFAQRSNYSESFKHLFTGLKISSVELAQQIIALPKEEIDSLLTPAHFEQLIKLNDKTITEWVLANKTETTFTKEKIQELFNCNPYFAASIISEEIIHPLDFIELLLDTNQERSIFRTQLLQNKTESLNTYIKNLGVWLINHAQEAYIKEQLKEFSIDPIPPAGLGEFRTVLLGYLSSQTTVAVEKPVLERMELDSYLNELVNNEEGTFVYQFVFSSYESSLFKLVSDFAGQENALVGKFTTNPFIVAHLLKAKPTLRRIEEVRTGMFKKKEQKFYPINYMFSLENSVFSKAKILIMLQCEDFEKIALDKEYLEKTKKALREAIVDIDSFQKNITLLKKVFNNREELSSLLYQILQHNNSSNTNSAEKITVRIKTLYEANLLTAEQILRNTYLRDYLTADMVCQYAQTQFTAKLFFHYGASFKHVQFKVEQLFQLAEIAGYVMKTEANQIDLSSAKKFFLEHRLALPFEAQLRTHFIDLQIAEQKVSSVTQKTETRGELESTSVSVSVSVPTGLPGSIPIPPAFVESNDIPLPPPPPVVQSTERTESTQLRKPTSNVTPSAPAVGGSDPRSALLAAISGGNLKATLKSAGERKLADKAPPSLSDNSKAAVQQTAKPQLPSVKLPEELENLNFKQSFLKKSLADLKIDFTQEITNLILEIITKVCENPTSNGIDFSFTANLLKQGGTHKSNFLSLLNKNSDFAKLIKLVYPSEDNCSEKVANLYCLLMNMRKSYLPISNTSTSKIIGGLKNIPPSAPPEVRSEALPLAQNQQFKTEHQESISSTPAQPAVLTKENVNIPLESNKSTTDSDEARNQMLNNIQSFNKSNLRKATTNDRSIPLNKGVSETQNTVSFEYKDLSDFLRDKIEQSLIESVSVNDDDDWIDDEIDESLPKDVRLEEVKTIITKFMQEVLPKKQVNTRSSDLTNVLNKRIQQRKVSLNADPEVLSDELKRHINEKALGEIVDKLVEHREELKNKVNSLESAVQTPDVTVVPKKQLN